MSDPPRRKPNRLKDYDYSQNGAYFLTICTAAKKCILSAIRPADNLLNRPHICLTDIGKTVEAELLRLNDVYPDLQVANHVIMPNHVHLLIHISTDDPAVSARVCVSRAVNQFKGAVTKRVGKPIWQKGYHDHVIRDDHDYKLRWDYIDDNPRRWEEDPEKP